MIRLGEKQELTVRRIKSFGVYLGPEGAGQDESVLLPGKYVPEGCKAGDHIEVFIYRDSSDRLVATTRQPALTLGGTALLHVVEVGPVGAFLDWGLEKDLLLPFKEQEGRPQKGDQVLAALYIDKSGRLCATMKVYDYLSCGSPYRQGDHVSGIIYQINPRVGVFVAVDGRYHGMIPAGNFHSSARVGAAITARVARVREDGKLELSLGEQISRQMDADGQKILDLLAASGGVLPFTEKADPQTIDRQLGMSKAAFKRAVGRLYRQRKIRLDKGKISLI